MIDDLLGWLGERIAQRPPGSRPLVTLSYAQSLDGCLTLHAGSPSPISGPESLDVTHHLRAAHDAILVGVGTVLADDPSLRVRRVEGRSPRPIVLDSHLRTPPGARLLTLGREPWIAALESADPARRAALEAAGAEVLSLPGGDDGRVSLPALLEALAARGITSIMVEGGAEVITSFLRAGLADLAVLTVAPVLAGGYHAVGELGVEQWARLPHLRGMQNGQAGEDLILWGELSRGG